MSYGVIRRPGRRAFAAAIGTAALIGIVACGGGASSAPSTESQSWDDVVAQAKEEGTVTLYGAVSQNVLTSITAAFEDEYGIKVEALQANAGPQHERVSRSLQARQVQVDVLINNDTPFLDELVQEGALQDLTTLPNRDEIDADWWPSSYPLR